MTENTFRTPLSVLICKIVDLWLGSLLDEDTSQFFIFIFQSFLLLSTGVAATLDLEEE
jgi:hypothetical protein